MNPTASRGWAIAVALEGEKHSGGRSTGDGIERRSDARYRGGGVRSADPRSRRCEDDVVCKKRIATIRVEGVAAAGRLRAEASASDVTEVLFRSSTRDARRASRASISVPSHSFEGNQTRSAALTTFLTCTCAGEFAGAAPASLESANHAFSRPRRTGETWRGRRYGPRLPREMPPRSGAARRSVTSWPKATRHEIGDGFVRIPIPRAGRDERLHAHTRLC